MNAWDIETFRSIHVSWRADGLDWPMRLLSATGLAHIQAIPLVAWWFWRADKKFFFSVFMALAIGAAAINGYGENNLLLHLAAVAAMIALWSTVDLRAFKAAFIGFALGGIFHLAVKQLVTRERPSMFIWAHPLENIYRSRSFPSGHTCTTIGMAAAMAIWLWQNDRRPAAIGWSVWGLTVGYSRVYVGVHYPTDVLGGICFGLAAAAIGTLFSPARPPKE